MRFASALLLVCSVLAAPLVLAQDPTARRQAGSVPDAVKDSAAAALPARGGCTAIPDDGYNGTIGSMMCLTVADPNNGQTIENVSVTIVAEHTWVGDLTVKVVSPPSSGSVVGTLMSRPGFVEPADDGTGCCGNSANLATGFPIVFDDDGGGPASETLGTGLTTSQVVCDTNGICNYVSSTGAATGNGLADFIGLTASGGDWQICIGDSGGLDTGNFCDASIEFATVSPDADLSVTKTAAAPSPLSVGDTIAYTLVASNAGPGAATGVVVNDPLPANVTYVSNTCGAAFAAPTLTWSIGALANGATASCDVMVTVASAGPIDNTATIAGDQNDPTPGNNSATAALGGATQPFSVVPATNGFVLAALAALMAGLGLWMRRRRHAGF